MVKPPLRTKSIGFKVSEEEYAQLETAAQADGTLGEWCREAILRVGSASDDPALAEIIGVRLLLVNVLGPVAAGEKVTPEKFNQLLVTAVMDLSRRWFRVGTRQMSQTQLQLTGATTILGVSLMESTPVLLWVSCPRNRTAVVTTVTSGVTKAQGIQGHQTNRLREGASDNW